MQAALSDALIRLSQDHIAFRKLLNVLDRQIEAVAQYRAPNFDVLIGALSYFREYSGRFHHPIEHLIYTVLKDLLPNVADGIHHVELQHVEIARESAAFATAVESMRADVEVSRRAFCDAARKFIAFERQHIRNEESSLFCLAVSALGAKEWLTVDREARLILAPLSRDGLAAHFHNLYIDVTTWDFENNHPIPRVR